MPFLFFLFLVYMCLLCDNKYFLIEFKLNLNSVYNLLYRFVWQLPLD